MPCFVWDTPSGRQVFDLSRAVLIVGRDTVADLVVEDATVSRRHALLQNEDGVVRITDLGSSSGTKINGAKITPDMPSSLDPGDFIQIGRLVFTYHHVAPPVAPPAAPTRIVKARPTAASSAASSGARSGAPSVASFRAESRERNVWKWVALAGAFVLVAVIGALVAVIAGDSSDRSDDEAAAGLKKASSGTDAVDLPVPPKAPETDQPEPNVETPKPSSAGTERAPSGALPPQQFCSPSKFPDLIELEGDRFFPVRTTTWDGITLRAVGSDGREYDIPQASIRHLTDRIDLARRAARSRSRLDPSDVSAHLDLAKWTAHRFIKSETRTLAQRVLALRPNDPEAARLLRSTE